MSSKSAISSGALSLALLLFGHGHLTSAAAAAAVTDPDLTRIYFDNVPYLANASNVIPMSWTALQAGFADPIREDVANFTGLDWTKPYPGSPAPGFTYHLRIADHLPLPASVTTEKAVIDVAAVNNVIPQSLRNEADDDGGLPKSMHPSWYICQHYYVSDLPDAASDVAHDCAFLPSQCQKDLKADLVANWGAYADETDGGMCGGWTFDTITPSCQEALGFVTADVSGFDASYLEDEAGARDATADEVGPYTWMVGDGFQEPTDETTWQTASNRTYLVATVFGYSSGYKSSVQPRVELSCLRPKWVAPEEPIESSSIATSSFAPSVTATLSGSGSASSSTKTTSAGSSTRVPSSGSSTATSFSTTAPASSLSLTLSKTTTTSTTSTAPASPSSTMHCTGGTTAKGVSGNLLGLCSYSCDFDHCLDPACVCTRSAAVAVPAPTQLAGKHGCPADNQSPANNSDYAYYVDLCEFICSRVVKESKKMDKFARARNARLIMSNQKIPNMKTDHVKPYCFWHPDVPSEKTLRELAKRYPDMAYQVGRACAVAGYDKLYHELGLLPEVSIAEEARESYASDKNPGSKAIFEHIMEQPVCYSVMDDYTRSVNTRHPRCPAFMNGDTAVRSTLDVTLSPEDHYRWTRNYEPYYERYAFDILETDHIGLETTPPGQTDQSTLPQQHVNLLYTPLFNEHLPTLIKNPLIVMAAYEGNLDRYLRLRRPKMVMGEYGAILRGIYHNTTFAKWWSLQPGIGFGDNHGDLRAATLARFIMVNDLSHITEADPDMEDRDEVPGMIWWPLVPAKETLAALAKLRPDMHLQVAMACIAGNYTDLWDKLQPEPCKQLWAMATGTATSTPEARHYKGWWDGSEWIDEDEVEVEDEVVEDEVPDVEVVKNHFTDYMERRSAELGFAAHKERLAGWHLEGPHYCNFVHDDWCMNAARVIKEPYVPGRLGYRPLCWLPRDLTIKAPAPIDAQDEHDLDFQRDNIYGGSVEQMCLVHWELNIAATEEIKARIPEGRDNLRLYEDIFVNIKRRKLGVHDDDDDDDDDDDVDVDKSANDIKGDGEVKASSSQDIDLTIRPDTSLKERLSRW
ncbi:hypothetical protein B0T20DRAFT_457738 [Sordaria brevicollis]|uniref:Uncharacterized protein n=1 Tax=Sordaria brevicollis TaxID=83679 RepID=A0AAE0U0L2_SORBR|nr:hypothetical protein B0T20DRAFT_457738 [Sordaria brevicollis]